ncbi:MAG: acylneuraminate cytidylyltransferase family protein [Methanobacterium sp.]
MNEKILCIIPARGGSKRLTGKNILDLCGKPLIAWTIEQARASKYLDKIIVSTDDEEIARISREYGAEVPFLRPAQFAEDDSPTIDAIKHAIEFLKNQGELYDILVLLEPTSPLRKKDDIDKAINIFLKENYRSDSLVSLGKVHLEDPVIMKKVDSGLVKPFIDVNMHQSDFEAYFPYGVIYLSKIDKLLQNKTFYQEHTVPYLIERWQNYEVDDIYDFICIESIMKLKLNEENKD